MTDVICATCEAPPDLDRGALVRSLDRIVAIKVLPAELTAREGNLKRFEREALKRHEDQPEAEALNDAARKQLLS